MRGILPYLTALTGLMATSPGTATVAVSGDPVLFWNEQLLSVLSGSPLVGGRNIAIVNVAIHDAVNASLGSPNRSWLSTSAGATGDTRAAASVAAHHALVALYSAIATALDVALAASLALIPDGTSKTDGMLTDAAVAAVLANLAADGSSARSAYVPVGGPGH